MSDKIHPQSAHYPITEQMQFKVNGQFYYSSFILCKSSILLQSNTFIENP
ncbi:MAG: hypothetical protein WCR58_11010 [Bacteroidales bacterium]|jgi:hypothetical protein|nr:hypothetical protein [Bacteroidales bacterium]MDD3702253.1 hypothetical protein [Bacteroidales bacterium]MDY0368872.1 hypothetical protein [Bacteroidales bacterium]